MPGKNSIKISVLIPVLNGEATIKQCLDGVFSQTLADDMEVIIVDSGSTDQTIEIVEKFPVRLYHIEPSSFNHGLTRNYAVSLARGEFVVFTVQDAIPADEKWIESMHQHFNDPGVAAVCGKQVVPHDKDKNPHEWYRPRSEPGFKMVYYDDPVVFESLDPAQKRKDCAWDNVTAMYRKQVLQKIPFRETLFAEDMMWAREALISGHTLVYDDRAQVFHYHHTDYNYQFKRTITVLYHQYLIFGYIPDWSFGLEPYFKILYRNIKWRASLYWLYYQWRKIAAAQFAFQRFMNKLRKGEDMLEKYHSKINPSAPQGVQSK